MASCVFCDIVKGIITANIVAENENALAFLDIQPLANGHTVIISKKHFKDITSTPKEVLSDMICLAKTVANILEETKYKPWGFNYLSNQGDIAGQAVFHVHLHVIPKYGKDEGFKLSKGMLINDNIEDVFSVINKTKEKL